MQTDIVNNKLKKINNNNNNKLITYLFQNTLSIPQEIIMWVTVTD